MLMTIPKYIDATFAEGSKPSVRTVKNWLKADPPKLYGKQIANRWYVDPDKEIDYVPNELVLKVLRSA